MARRTARRRKLVIGLTGSFGTGKTTVAGMLKARGAAVVDADKLARRALRRGSTAYRKTVRAFGKGITGPGGHIDRRVLASIVFSDRRALGRLSAIVHPPVIRMIRRKIAAARKDAVVIDAPLLIEAGLAGGVDRLVVVRASRRKQAERCRAKFGMTAQEVAARVRNQLALARKVKRADFVIDNNGSLRRTSEQVRMIWRRLWNSER